MRLRAFIILPLFAACASADSEPELGTNDVPSFEDFEAATYHEPWDNGVYVVNGDTPVLDRKALFEIWSELYGQALIVHTVNGVDARWDEQTKLDLTYCISNAFGTNKQAVIDAMAGATDQGWETFANVNFVYHPEQDTTCTDSNNSVVFDVNPVIDQPYLARAFFPNSPRPERNILIDSSAFNTTWTLRNILGHETGHTIGFRHEHTRPEAGTCFEDDHWRPLTPYDSASVMHYPQCNGTANDLAFTQMDADGAAILYGPASGEPPPPPPPPPDGEYHESGTLALNEMHVVPAFSVEPGSRFEAVITGTGDADLYVRFGAAPTLTQWNCRPYTASASESCVLDVPTDQNTVYVAIHGYTASTFNLTVHYVTGGEEGPPELLVNELLADPAPYIDANGDGTISSTADEMIEFVNIGGSAADLSHATITDNVAVRVVVPDGTIVGPGEALVVFGGGTAPSLGAHVHVVVGSGSLYLNNTGDAVTLRDSGGAVLATASYGAAGDKNASLNRSPELDPAAPLVLHTVLAPGVRASPGRHADGTPY